MASESHKRLALAIVDFLSSSLKDGTLQPEDADSIEIASNCIAECFHVDPSDKAATKEALGDQNLLKIYSVYEKLKGKNAPAASGSAAGTSASVPKAMPKETLEVKGHPTEESEKLKGQGNAAMQKKDYNRAIDFYTQALDISPLNTIYLSNRAAAYSASNQHEAAMHDAELAVTADPKYTKAWSRLGLAKFALGDAKGSMDAYKSGIDAEGNGGSDAMKKGYETAKRKVEEESVDGDDDEDDDIGAPDAGARGAPGAGGMPDLSALAGMFGGGGGAGGAGGGMPDLSALAGMMGGGGAGGGGMPDIGAMMQNPMMRQMAQQVMQNPEMLSGLMNRFGGGGAGAGAGAGAGGAAGGAPGGRGGGMPDLSAMMNDPAIAEMARNFMGGGAGGAGRGAALAGSQEDEPSIAVKQYTPLDNHSPGRGDVTIIGAHANGFPKELYEPLWDELYSRLQAKGIAIRNIWIADVAHQGVSGVLNEHKLGNDPSWNDHPRDLFILINHFRHEIRRPIIGIGHSMGGCHLVNLSLMHPRLFTTLILIDPVIQRLPSRSGNYGPAKASTVRRDRWPSRKAAEAAFKRSKFYQTWDPRVLDLWVKYGLRELPTLLHSDIKATPAVLPAISADPSSAAITTAETEVTLLTTKHQEVFTFMRPNYPTADFPEPSEKPNPLTHPDVDPAAGPNDPFYRPEPLATFHKLPALRPGVQYIFGDQSFLSAPMLKADKMAATGSGIGGSGGVTAGRVREHTFKGIGHLIPMEVVGETADVCTEWLVPELTRWKQLEQLENEAWSRVPSEEKGRMNEEFLRVMTSDWNAEPGAKPASKPKL
ncbi:hypothetical protein B0A48_15202 [Cryoendolithus antarcticus]|uniref:Uncharacterized protein n=1 Tax=Cryoendolithus antarcticus TaxID=1507870 RepID=A0A1V8SI88_9PEZI|nr:hypothetical protein B0A48_15202 [Cryoendolithus antarcticus]